MKDREAKAALARLAGDACDGRLGRRDFLRRCGRLGLGFSATALAAMAMPRPWPRLVTPAAAAGPAAPDLRAWLKDVGGGFRGTTVRMVTETTAPNQIIKQLAEEEFTPLTGIDVHIELLPLERVLQRTSQDIAGKSGRYDIYYLDQSWIARFADDTVDTREKYRDQPDLALPGYDWDDFLPSLVTGISSYGDRLVGIPFDVPIFIQFYRQDLLAELGLQVPATLDDYMAVVRAIQARYPDVEIVVPGHGAVGDRALLDHTLELLEAP